MTVLERFLKYVSFETTALKERDDSCSNPLMLNLVDELVKELLPLEPEEISINKFGIIDCKFKGYGKKNSVAFLAHVDTSNQASGKDVKPSIIDYEGQDIKLSEGRILSIKEFPSLKNSIGHKIIVTDGTTLLGGDDKAGIAIIMTSLNKVLKEKNNRPLEIIFTTDEEIGADAEHVSLRLLSSPYGYTIDGGDYRFISIESFTAYSMEVSIQGRSIHPGSAKGKMVNAVSIFTEFHDSLPKFLRPEYTEQRQPFYHICEVKGCEDTAHASYIIRSFDEDEIEKMIELAKFTAMRINEREGYECIHLDIKNQYHNMKRVIDKYPEIMQEVEKAYKESGLDYEYEMIRGGTTGSQLSFKGLPCPNLGTGDYNCHGQYEYVDLNEMEKMVEIVTKLMEK